MKPFTRILITGTTGLVGFYLLKTLINTTEGELVLLIRSSSYDDAVERCKKLLVRLSDPIPDLNKIMRRIKMICGDLTKINFGINTDEYNSLCQSITEIYHCAALTGLRETLESLRSANVLGTKNVLEFAAKCKKLKKVNYVSSIFISGTYKGDFSEEDLNFGQSFNNAYEQSKFEAELIVRDYIKSGMSVVIYRPGIIVGDYETGLAFRPGLLYHLFRILSLEIFQKFPLNVNTVLNILPCDIVAEAIYRLSIDSQNSDVYHLLNNSPILLTHIIHIASNVLNCKEPEYVDKDIFRFNDIDTVKRRILEPFVPYFNLQTNHCSTKTLTKLKKIKFEYPKIDDKFLLKMLDTGKKSNNVQKKFC